MSSLLRSASVATIFGLIGLPDCLIAAIAPSMRGWMFSAPGVAMNSATSPFGTERRDPLAHGEARLVERLADVRHPRLRAGPRSVGVVGQRPGSPSSSARLIGASNAPLSTTHDGDPVRLGADRGVERVDHLADVRLRRAAPRVLHVDERCGVGGAVLRRHEERVRRHVVDERELPVGVRRVLPVRGAERRLRAHESRQRSSGASERDSGASAPRDRCLAESSETISSSLFTTSTSF